MRQMVKEHLNALRDHVQDAAKHFLWYFFAKGSDVVVESLVEYGMGTLQTKKMVSVFYLYWVRIYEKWLSEDVPYRALKNRFGQGSRR